MKPTKGLSIPVIWPLLPRICIFAPAERSGPERSSNPSGAEISVDVIFHPKISIDGFNSGLKELDRIQLYFKKVRTAVEGVRAPARIIQLQRPSYRLVSTVALGALLGFAFRTEAAEKEVSRERARVDVDVSCLKANTEEHAVTLWL